MNGKVRLRPRGLEVVTTFENLYIRTAIKRQRLAARMSVVMFTNRTLVTITNNSKNSIIIVSKNNNIIIIILRPFIVPVQSISLNAQRRNNSVS